jgi:signal transduction histidine kinase
MGPPSIFLSHTWSDKPFARKLGDELRRSGAKVWIDEAEIRLGDSLIQKVGEGIDTCDYLGVILSPEAVASEWVSREVELAVNREIAGKRVIALPLLYRRCKIPIFLSSKLYADFTEPALFLSSLNKIKERLGLPLTPERLTVEQATEDLLHQVRSPLLQARARLNHLLHSVGEGEPLYSDLSLVRSLVDKTNLVTSRFALLQAFSRGRYPVHIMPLQEVTEVIHKLVMNFVPLEDPDRRVRIVQEDSSHPKAGFDQRLLEVAIASLLDNALKYSYSNTPIQIACRERDDSVQVIVSNCGLPIDFDQEKMFQNGFRGEAAKDVTGEVTGLGLYLTQQIMMAHGGTIKYRKGRTENDHNFILDWPKQYSPDAA